MRKESDLLLAKIQLNNMEATIISLQTTHVGNDNQHMTSLEIAEVTGKQHKHVMEAIRKMEPAWVQVAGSNFRLGSYKDLNGQLRPCYILTKTECLHIATKFNDEARVDAQRSALPELETWLSELLIIEN